MVWPRSRRRRAAFAFLTVNLALVGCVIVRWQIKEAAIAKIEAAGGSVRRENATWLSNHSQQIHPRLLRFLTPVFDRVAGVNVAPGTWHELSRAVLRFSALETLTLSGQEITDDEISRLATLKELWSLSLTETQVTGRTFSSLPTLAHVEWDARDDSLSHLAACPKLQTLHLRGQAVTNKAAQHLRDTESLQVLEISATRLTKTGLVKLKDHPSLQHVILSGYTDDVASLNEQIPRIHFHLNRGVTFVGHFRTLNGQIGYFISVD